MTLSAAAAFASDIIDEWHGEGPAEARSSRP
jgi:hypothetical protein